MLEFLMNKKIRVVVWNSILVVLGLFFCFLPKTALSTFEVIVIFFIIFYGLICMCCYIFTGNDSKDYGLLTQSIVFIVLGVLMNIFDSLFIIAIGIYLLIEGVNELGYSTVLKQENKQNWWIDALIGIILFCLGVTSIILCNTSVGTNIVSIFLGISIISYGASNLIRIYCMKRNYYDVKIVLPQTSNKNKEENDSNDVPNDDDFKDFSVK